MLQLRAIDAGYGSFQALFDVSLDVNAGEAVAVIGPNGAGKTTLMRVISGLIRPMRGSMHMEGTDLAATPPHRIVELGIAHVPENRRLFARMTVEDNLRMGGFIPAARAKFRERLDFVYQLFPRLRERRSQLAGTLSGGEQQMCAIGRALMSEPRLLLLDEPSAGLAPVVVQQVFGLVERIRASGLTVLIVEQNVRQVLRVVDRAYLLEAGTLRASGAAGELLESERFAKPTSVSDVFDIFDIYLLEALINGVLLGGVLALLALGLNLIFGVIDVVWICYAELIMLGMYGMFFLFKVYHVPFLIAAVICIVRRRRAWRRAASAGDRAAAWRRADQPVAGDRRRAVLPAERRHGHVRHRLPQPRHSAAGADGVRHVHQLRAAAGVRRGACRAWWCCICSLRAPIPARRSAPSRRTGRSCR